MRVSSSVVIVTETSHPYNIESIVQYRLLGEEM